MKNKYQEILSMPRHRSKKRMPMPTEIRAAQFSPFAALSGFEDTIGSQERSAEGIYNDRGCRKDDIIFADRSR